MSEIRGMIILATSHWSFDFFETCLETWESTELVSGIGETYCTLFSAIWAFRQ
jgi:hypothetical protein